MTDSIYILRKSKRNKIVRIKIIKNINSVFAHNDLIIARANSITQFNQRSKQQCTRNVDSRNNWIKVDWTSGLKCVYILS